MCCFWKKSRSPHESSAKVVDGNLILSLPDALNPIVWRMELGSVKSSALEVRAQDNNFLLTLKTPRGDVHDIAPYDNRDKAVAALLKVSDALEGAHGKMGTVAANTSYNAALQDKPASTGTGYKWLIALAAVILLIFLYSYLSSLTTGLTSIGEGAGTAPISSAGESGVPQSADDYLRGF